MEYQRKVQFAYQKSICIPDIADKNFDHYHGVQIVPYVSSLIKLDENDFVHNIKFVH